MKIQSAFGLTELLIKQKLKSILQFRVAFPAVILVAE